MKVKTIALSDTILTSSPMSFFQIDEARFKCFRWYDIQEMLRVS